MKERKGKAGCLKVVLDGKEEKMEALMRNWCGISEACSRPCKVFQVRRNVPFGPKSRLGN